MCYVYDCKFGYAAGKMKSPYRAALPRIPFCISVGFQVPDIENLASSMNCTFYHLLATSFPWRHINILNFALAGAGGTCRLIFTCLQELEQENLTSSMKRILPRTDMFAACSLENLEHGKLLLFSSLQLKVPA